MKAFAQLFRDLDQTNSTREKIDIMTRFFSLQDAETAAWSLYFLAGRRPKKLIGSAKLRFWAQEETGYPTWLMDECYAAVGDTAEMVALILGASLRVPKADSQELSLGQWMEKILALAKVEDEESRKLIVSWWRDLETSEIFVLNKLLTGGLRVGVSETLVYRAVAEALSLPRSTIQARLLGSWTPSAEFFKNISRPEDANDQVLVDSAPEALPFCLAAPLAGELEDLGPIEDWQVEWKWDGIRVQIVKANSHVEIWSRGEERVTHSFPDLALQLRRLPGRWILDGELVAGDWRKPSLFQELQKRLGRKKPALSFQKENPVAFLAYDFLREESETWTEKPLEERRKHLEDFLQPHIASDLGYSQLIECESWHELSALRLKARGRGAEGLMIKRKSAGYEFGRKRGIWYKWKVDPLTIDAVLTAAQPGTGRRASLYTDYTFSVWRRDELVPIAKAYSGLTDQEIGSLDHWIRRHTTERFGPVRMLEQERVFEIGFEGLAESTRHKSGFALRFPRILRERIDKKPPDANSVEDLDALLQTLRSP